MSIQASFFQSLITCQLIARLRCRAILPQAHQGDVQNVRQRNVRQRNVRQRNVRQRFVPCEPEGLDRIDCALCCGMCNTIIYSQNLTYSMTGCSPCIQTMGTNTCARRISLTCLRPIMPLCPPQLTYRDFIWHHFHNFRVSWDFGCFYPLLSPESLPPAG